MYSAEEKNEIALHLLDMIKKHGISEDIKKKVIDSLTVI